MAVTSTHAPVSALLVLFILICSTSQFYIPQDTSNISTIKHDDYQFLLTSNMKLLIFKGQKLEAQLKSSQPCQPVSIQIWRQGVKVEIANSAQFYTINIRCQFRRLTFKYSALSKTLQQVPLIQMNQLNQDAGNRRLLQNNNITSSCGNKVLETFEECDDGNKISGDGCSVSCTYQCGDGNLNSVLQQCDDGNRKDGDGCSSTCKTEYSGAALGVGLGVSIGVAALVGVVVGQVAVASSTAASAVASAGASSIVGVQPVGNIQLGQTMKMMNAGGVI